MTAQIVLTFAKHFHRHKRVRTYYVRDSMNLQGANIGRGITLQREVGRGGFGTVYRAVSREGHWIAAKVAHRPIRESVVPHGPMSHFAWLSEITNQSLVDSHPNLLPLLGIRVFEGRLILLYPFVSGWTLQSEIDSPSSSRESSGIWQSHQGAGGHVGASFVNVLEVYRAMYQVLCAVIGCHACGVLHLDLKPSNILISELNRHVFVSDFGTSRLAEAREISSGTLVGTRYFVAPELLRGERARKRSDCFSWGMCLLAALGGEPLQWSDRLKGPCRIEIERRLAVLPTGFVSLVPFVVAALSSDPIARPRLGEIERAMREIPGVSVRSTAHPTVPREGSLSEDIRSLAQKLSEMFG